ncbi:MAG TPA: hypothetical protein VFE33_08430 [Thermoanaerobaculia bacterium]|nr:hypothetical protein [Thermoanaerobaculia bacterium]
MKIVAITLMMSLSLALGASAAGTPPLPERPKLVEVVVSPQLAPQDAAAAETAVFFIFRDVLKGGDTLVVTDAGTLQRITSLTVSPRIVSREGKYRRWKMQLHTRDLVQLATYFRDLKQRNSHSRPALDIPGVMEVLAQREAQYAQHDRQVVFFGSPIFLDRHNTGYSFVDCFPSDGHLRAAISPFSTLGKAGRLQGLTVHLIHPAGDFYNDIHQQKLKRFWTLWFSLQGASLVSFTPDAAVWERVAAAHLPAIQATYDPTDAKVQMYSVKRLPVDLWAELPPSTPPPAAQTKGALMIGIRWTGPNRAADLDLYSGFQGNDEQLFFAHQQSTFGRHLKDYRTGGDEYETIEYFGEVDIRQVRAAVNFYSGAVPAGPKGEVRVVFAGQVFAAPFKLTATSGNGGRTGPGQEQYWLTLDLPAIVRLTARR